jgi:flavodoxin
MSSLVLFDSNYGNTKIIADTIAAKLGTAAVSVAGLDPFSLAGVDLLVVGSPIIGWKPSERMQAFLANLGEGTLRGVKAAAFDTRVRLFIHGDAAGKISHALEKAGARIVARPHGFIVDGRQGPLAHGEVDKAAAWAGAIAVSVRP